MVRFGVNAGLAELADADDSKSSAPKGLPGSIPGTGTKRFDGVPNLRSLQATVG
jgi:hypothetical protein